MLDGMKEIANGREPERIERSPAIEGGNANHTDRSALHGHEFDPLRVLIAKP
jgi:hypothetical protein